jgi:ABC-type uncharacterized transport system involved in gliding motility auxiliary subunit
MADPAKQQRPWRYHRHASLFTLVVLAINTMLYVITVTYNQRLDVTRTKQFTLANQTVKLLRAVQQSVKVTGFFRSEDPKRKQFEDLLEQYRYYSKHVDYEIIDLDRHPILANRYPAKDRPKMMITGNEKEEKVFHLEEEALTNALYKLMRKGKKGIYFTIGHGESSRSDTTRNGYSLARQRLQEQNYNVKELLLAHHERLPADVAVLVIAGPRTDFSESEIRTLTTYLESGGHVLIMIDPETSSDLSSFLARYGIILGNDWVIETNALGRLFGGDYHMPAVTASTGHPITRELGAIRIIFPVARSVRIARPLPAGICAQVLISTSHQSWADTDLVDLQRNRSSFEEGRDRKGPISIAVVATVAPRQSEDKDGQPVPNARLIVLGDSEFASNHFLTLQGNNDFFSHMIRWLAAEEKLTVGRSPIGGRGKPVVLPTTPGPLIFWLPVVFLPLTVFVCSIIVCSRRRWQR